MARNIALGWRFPRKETVATLQGLRTEMGTHSWRAKQAGKPPGVVFASPLPIQSVDTGERAGTPDLEGMAALLTICRCGHTGWLRFKVEKPHFH